MIIYFYEANNLVVEADQILLCPSKYVPSFLMLRYGLMDQVGHFPPELRQCAVTSALNSGIPETYSTL